MFETHDMLPRPPPRPSAPPNAVTSIPSVPEVSIIFGKPTTVNDSQVESHQQTTPSTYAEWKKANLPRVAFPPHLSDELNYPNKGSSSSPGFITTRSSVYPMRTVTVPTTCVSGGGNTCMSAKSSNAILTLATPPSSLGGQLTYHSEQRRSMDSISQRSQAMDAVLTICASTQTDANQITNNTTVPYVCNKQFAHLIDMIKVLREEQEQMRHIIEKLVQQQEYQQQQQQAQAAIKVFCYDKATQCDETEMMEAKQINIRSASIENIPPFTIVNETLHHALPNVKIYSHSTAQETEQTPPIAPIQTPVSQPILYRPNTPINIRQNGTSSSTTTPTTNNLFAQNINTLPKPNSERSMVMNELALKYLPSDKLNELMQDAQITTIPNSIKRPSVPVPLRENDNFNRKPTDISNASYKYLRKYRLLPDENRRSPTTNNGQQSSPFQGLQDLPLAYTNGSSTAINETESPHLDLENIRRQPKFM